MEDCKLIAMPGSVNNILPGPVRVPPIGGSKYLSNLLFLMIESRLLLK